MTRSEFSPQYARLCNGLEYQATTDQAEAMFRRIGHVSFSVWEEVVTTLLCDGRKGYLPKLEHVMTVLDEEGERQRKAATVRDRSAAGRLFGKLSQDVIEACAKMSSSWPTPGTPLFACILAYGRRQEAARRYALVPEQWTEKRKNEERAYCGRIMAQAELDITRYSPLVSDEDAAKLVQRYERPSVDGTGDPEIATETG